MKDGERETLKENWGWKTERDSRRLREKIKGEGGRSWMKERERQKDNQRTSQRERERDVMMWEGKRKKIIIPFFSYNVRFWLVEWPLGQPPLCGIINGMTEVENIVQTGSKDLRQGYVFAALLWPAHGFSFLNCRSQIGLDSQDKLY